MQILYEVNGHTAQGNQINGIVIIDSQCRIEDRLYYTIVKCKFICNGLVCESNPLSDTAGEIRIPRGRAQDEVTPGISVWRMGDSDTGSGLFKWITDTGVTFKHIDNSSCENYLMEYQHLQPYINLCCDNVEINSRGPFIPSNWLSLTWRCTLP